MQAALKRIEGTYAFAVVSSGGGEIVAAKNESPLVIGLGDGENFIASDVTALLRYTDRMLYLMDGEAVRVTRDSVSIVDKDGRPVTREPQKVLWNILLVF